MNPALSEDGILALPPWVRLRFDPVRGRHVLPAPERVPFACPIAVAVLERPGEGRRFGDPVETPAAEFDAPREVIARAVRAAGLPLTAHAVVHRHNIDRLEEVIALAMTLDAHRPEVAHVEYYGWALLNRKAPMPTRARLAHSNRVVERAREKLRGRLVIDHVVPDYRARRPKPCMGGGGWMVINVTPSGRALPCHAAYVIPGPTFPSVREASLAWIWQESVPFRAFRGTGRMREPCRSCERREVGFGGCRRQAMLLTGDPRNADPACELSPRHRAVREPAEAESTGDAPFVPRRPMRRPPAMPVAPLPAAEG